MRFPLTKYLPLLAALLLAFTIGTAKLHDHQWSLDDLGNWVVGVNTSLTATNGLRSRTFDEDSALITDQRRGHRTDDRNQVGTAIRQKILDDSPDPAALETRYAYDLAGRMRYDGRALYEHDAFGRLVQVRGAPDGTQVNADGSLQAPAPWTIQALAAHYTYDGLGRVIRTQRPAAAGSTAPANSARLCVTDYYYDGLRVVQEVGWGGKAQSAGGGGGQGVGGVSYRTNRTKGGDLDTSLPGLPRRANEMAGTGVTGGQCAPTGIDWDFGDRRLEREYVWAGNSGAYVDECVAQLVYTDAHVPASGSTSGQAAYKGNDTTATVLYTLADHNANVVGLTDWIGRLVGQFGYTPYGETRSAEYFAPDASSLTNQELVTAAKGNRLGHQGLRTERFDRPWDGALDVATAVGSGGGTASTGAYRALCHNRNRMYDPAEGRFLEQDPNGLGTPVCLAFSCGHSVKTAIISTDMMRQYRDGQNTHVAYQGSPVSTRDPLGLYAVTAPRAGVGAAYIGGGILVGGLLLFYMDVYSQALDSAVSATSSFVRGAYDSAEALYGWVDAQIGMFGGAAFGAGIAMAVSQKDALKTIYGQVRQIEKHLKKLGDAVNEGLPDPMWNKVREEIWTALKTVEHKIGSLGRGTAEVWSQRLAEWVEKFVELGGKWP